MTWTITVEPTDSTLKEWGWVAVSADQNHVIDGGGLDSHATALAAAKATVDEIDRKRQIIEAATTTEDYTPIVEEIGAQSAQAQR